jgi:hypothetical protein
MLSFSVLPMATVPAFGASVYAVTSNQTFGTLDLNTGAFSQIGGTLPEEGSGLAPDGNGTF